MAADPKLRTIEPIWRRWSARCRPGWGPRP